MEYTFRRSAHEAETIVVLDEYTLRCRKGENEEVISYASITSVRVSRLSKHVFKIHLSADGHRPIAISNQSLTETGALVDQSTGYALFVRVLHRYLKDKSQAVFRSGGNTDRLWQRIALSIVFSFYISIVAGYLGFSLMNPYTQALIFATLSAVMIILFGIRKLPKSYDPSDIPLQFLP